MALIYPWLTMMWNAILALLIHPFLYLSIVIVLLQYRKQIVFERKCFNLRIHSLIGSTLSSVGWGSLIGLLASILLVGSGVVLRPTDLLWVWGLSAILALWKVRYLCIAYAAGVIGLLQAIVSLFPTSWIDSVPVFQSLQNVHLASLFALVALLHVMEAILVRLQAARSASPTFIQGKRGKVVGGYRLQRFWPVPMLLWMQLPDGSISFNPLVDNMPDWWPFFGSGAVLALLSLLPFPIMMGFSTVTVTQYPEQQAKQASRHLFLYGLVIAFVAVVVQFMPVLAIGGSIVSFGLHEALIWYQRYLEQEKTPIYVHTPKGLMVLAVLPDGPADAMGVMPGEMLHRVNGFLVTTKEQLHQALQANSAYCKLEIINREGQLKFAKRSLYDGEHHQLGIILAPDDQARYALAHTSESLLHWLKIRQKERKEQPSRAGEAFSG